MTEYLEQWADDWYNWLLQLLYVYDPGFQFIGGGVPPKVIVSVKEGSLLPKDSTSIANQAIELGTQNKMALVDMYKRLEYPNPEELAANVWLEINAPHLLYADNPKVQQALQMQAEAAAAQAEADAQSKTNESMMKHDQNIESKLVDGSVKKSLLSEVPSKQ